MIHLTVKNFKIETAQSNIPVVVMFYANWCGKCAMMKPIAEAMEKKYKGRIKFCEIEIEESAVLTAEYGVEIVPTFVMYKGGEIESVMQGVLEESLFEERIKDLL